MRTVLYNGNIYQGRNQFAEALIIDNGRIQYVGSNVEARNADHIDESIDCEGRTVVPGFNDTHMHMMMMGETMNMLSLYDCTSIDQIIERARAFVEAHPEVRRTGLHGRGWNQDFFTGEKRILTRHDADQISTEFPVVLERVCGHIVAANTHAINLLGLHADSPQYPGGTFEIGADGELNGVFTELACPFVYRLITQPDRNEKERRFRQAMEYAVSCGLTSVQSNDLGSNGIGRTESYEILRAVMQPETAPLRLHMQICSASPDALQQDIQDGIYSHAAEINNGWLSVGPLKLFMDGSLGARTALIRAGYHDDPNNHGEQVMSQEELDQYCEIANRNGIQVVTHGIGDGAIEAIINSYERVAVNGKNPLRNGIIHCQITDVPLLQRMVNLSIPAFYQPIFINYDRMITDARVGSQMASTSYAFRSFPAMGGIVSYGTDAPVEDCNPLQNLYSAIVRKSLNGQPEGGWYPEECVNIYDAVDAYTVGSAFCQHMEADKGRLAAGQLADMVILDHNIFNVSPEEVRDTLPVRTIVGGRTVFSA